MFRYDTMTSFALVVLGGAAITTAGRRGRLSNRDHDVKVTVPSAGVMLDWRRELVLLGAVYVLEVVVFSSAFTGRLGTPSAVVVALYMGLLIAPLWWRHRAPAAVFAVVWLLAMVANLAVRGAH